MLKEIIGIFAGSYRVMRILFVCHGNICRSPMAEFIMKALVKARGLEWGCEAMLKAAPQHGIG